MQPTENRLYLRCPCIRLKCWVNITGKRLHLHEKIFIQWVILTDCCSKANKDLGLRLSQIKAQAAKAKTLLQFSRLFSGLDKLKHSHIIKLGERFSLCISASSISFGESFQETAQRHGAEVESGDDPSDWWISLVTAGWTFQKHKSVGKCHSSTVWIKKGEICSLISSAKRHLDSFKMLNHL